MLPAGCKRVEWIASTGTQYVNTGMTPNQDTSIHMDAIPLSVGTASGDGGFFLGSGYPVQQNGFEAYAYGGHIHCIYNGTEIQGGTVSAGQHFKIKFDKNICTVTADGALVFNHTFAYTAFTSPVPLELFVLPRQSRFYGVLRLEACQIYDNGTIVRDYIPCIDTTGDATLWDDVNGAFAEKEGTFVAGPIVEPPSAPESVYTALSVLLRWNASTGADSYNIYRNGVLIGTTTAAQYVDTTADENETYTYAVSAVGIGGESARTKITVYTRTGYFQYKPYIQSANFQ